MTNKLDITQLLRKHFYNPFEIHSPFEIRRKNFAKHEKYSLGKLVLEIFLYYVQKSCIFSPNVITVSAWTIQKKTRSTN